MADEKKQREIEKALADRLEDRAKAEAEPAPTTRTIRNDDDDDDDLFDDVPV